MGPIQLPFEPRDDSKDSMSSASRSDDEVIDMSTSVITSTRAMTLGSLKQEEISMPSFQANRASLHVPVSTTIINTGFNGGHLMTTLQASQSTLSLSPKPKKKPQPIPEECKDGAYWERRKRNNESAKRSREIRRIKEQQTSLRVMYLEQENLQLKTEVNMLRNEVEKLRQMLYTKGTVSS